MRILMLPKEDVVNIRYEFSEKEACKYLEEFLNKNGCSFYDMFSIGQDLNGNILVIVHQTPWYKKAWNFIKTKIKNR